MSWTVTNFKPYRKNTLMGYFTLVVESVEFEGFSLHEKNGRRWAAFPSKEYVGSDGQKKYFPTVKILDKKRLNQFQQWVVPAVEELMRNA